MLDKIAESVRSCTDCVLCEDRTNAVPGMGSGSSGIMFVGEAPGRSEDLRGRPFVGRAGRILDEALASAGISRHDAYITNVVKCRPPRNRVPHRSEKDACWRHLEAEIKLLKPLVICVMGNTACSSLLGDSGITTQRGRLVRHGSTTYYITIHPAAVIYNRDLEGVLARDMRRLADIIRDMKSGRAISYDTE